MKISHSYDSNINYSYIQSLNIIIIGAGRAGIVETTFKFDGDKIKHKLDYQGNGKAPDKRVFLVSK